MISEPVSFGLVLHLHYSVAFWGVLVVLHGGERGERFLHLASKRRSVKMAAFGRLRGFQA